MLSSIWCYAIGLSALSAAVCGAALPGSAGPPTLPGNDLDITFDQPDVPKWPIRGVDVLKLPPSKAYPHINLTLVYNHSASCLNEKMENYQFLNGTRRDATLQDMVNDLDKAYNDDGPEDLVDIYLRQTLEIAAEVYKLVNDTLDWFNIEDNPDEGLLPLPPQWQDEYRQKHANEQVIAQPTSQVSKERRMEGQGSDASSVPVDVDELQTPRDPPVRTMPGLAPRPDTEEEPESVDVAEPVDKKRPRRDIVCDWIIIVVGASFGASIAYGGLSIGTLVPSIKKHVWATNFFGAAGLAFGIITGVLIGMIQRWQAEKHEMMNKKAKDVWRAGQIGAMRQQLAATKRAMREFREMQMQLARERTPNPSQLASATRRTVQKPIDALRTTSNQIKDAATGSLKRAGSSFGDLADAMKTKLQEVLPSSNDPNRGSISDTDPLTSGNPDPSDDSVASAPENLETGKAETPPMLTPVEYKAIVGMPRASTQPRSCPLPKPNPNAVAEDPDAEAAAFFDENAAAPDQPDELNTASTE